MSAKASTLTVALAAGVFSCGGRASNYVERLPPASDENNRAANSGASVDLGIEFACGFRAASQGEHFEYRSSGQNCAPESEGINSFALRLTGSSAGDYSAVARCGYIRYDNGTFVGERVEVEARDGQWCDELALAQIDLVDRMLLTDVSFALEAKSTSAPSRTLTLAISTRGGWTEPVPAETNLCIYVANRQTGAWACRLAPPSDYCFCPKGDAWQDFMTDAKVSLAPL